MSLSFSVEEGLDPWTLEEENEIRSFAARSVGFGLCEVAFAITVPMVLHSCSLACSFGFASGLVLAKTTSICRTWPAEVLEEYWPWLLCVLQLLACSTPPGNIHSGHKHF